MENMLMAYGPLGAWTLWLLYEKQRMLKGLNNVLEQNTQVLREICIYLKDLK